MSLAHGPKRHLMRRSHWSPSEEERTWRGHPNSVVPGPEADIRFAELLQCKAVLQGVAALTTQTALTLASVYDFGRHRHVLDLGGGTGNFLVVLLNRYPGLTGTLYELSDTAAVARQVLAGTPEAERIKIVEGDFFTDSIPAVADAIIVANIVHLFSPARNHDLLEHVRRQAAVGTRLLLVDVWTDPTHTLPTPVAMLAGEFLLFAGEGDVYSEEEIQRWLRETGWRPVDHRPLAGPASLIVAETA